MAELLLGAILPTLVEHLLAPALLKLARREKVDDLVEKWIKKLKSISRLLEDAEAKAMRGDESVKVWLDDLRDLVYDIEDVVDEFVTEEKIRSSFSTEAAVTGNKVRSLLPSCCTGLSPRKLMLDHELRSKMEKNGERLDAILEQKKDLELSESSGSSINNTSSHSSPRVTTSIQESYVVGREEDEKAILSKLAEETEDLSVISIVGLCGIGKTTLAKSVFHHRKVTEAFPLRGWACVSDNFDKLGIARALLGSLTRESVGNENDLNVLHNKLEEILSKQKFLIVLDDYWNTDYINWDEMCNLFKPCVKGSKVIVTTRDLNVSFMMRDRQPISLQKLSTSDCLSLLAHHALGVDTFDGNSNLKPIGKEIALKCNGLPLAAKALGGLLRFKHQIPTEWEDIRNSKIRNVEFGKSDIFLALMVSYVHLPLHLKKCFVYCAIFPKNHEFDRDELVLLWMAEGFVEMKGSNTRRGKLDQGRKQFNELLNRSFFQQSTQNESKFVMHDLMRNLASSIGGNTCLNVKLERIGVVIMNMSPEKVRHLLYSSRPTLVDAKLEKCHVLKSLRTFYSLESGLPKQWSVKALEELLENLKCLRTLSLFNYTIETIPNCIKSLKHLRYLNFSYNDMIKVLPESICTLYNLETLILRGCGELFALPPGMDKLINLKYLDIRETPNLKKMPVEFGHMHNFEILTKFIVGKEDSLRLNALGHSPHLQGELFILGLQNVEDTNDATNAKLNAKVGLTTLALVWSLKDDSGSSSRNPDKEKEVIELLQPHQKIKELEINGYGGICFPLWVDSPSMTNMTRIRLRSCATVTSLPSFGLLPCLRELEIQGMDDVCSVGSEFYGNTERPFQALEVLKIKDMRAWGVWSSSWGDKEIEEPFPRLISLMLENCPKLVSKLPYQLRSIVKLRIQKCPLLQAKKISKDALSSLKELTLEGCHYDLLAMISSKGRNTLTSISLDSIEKLLYLNEDTLSLAKRLVIQNCGELIGLWEDNVSEAVGASLTRLESLTIIMCKNLHKLPNNMQRLTSLTHMTITNCSKLEFLPEEIMNCNLKKLKIVGCGSLKVSKLPTSLVNFEFSRCGVLKLLDDFFASTSAVPVVHLQEVVIAGHSIKSITHFLFTKMTNLVVSDCYDMDDNMLLNLPSCLQSLQLSRCNKIKSLSHQMHTTLTSLQCLKLCELSIECFLEGGLPLSLEELRIEKCKELKQPLKEWGLNKLTALKRLYLVGEIGSLCLQEGMVTSFPPLHSDWTHFPSRLEIFELSGQPDMVSLSNGLQCNLTSLRELVLYKCPKLRSLTNEGFPTSLECLRISYCPRDIQIKCSKNGEYFPLIESIPCLYFYCP